MKMEQGVTVISEGNESANSREQFDFAPLVSEGGFTLLEILIVLGIVGGLLAAILTSIGGGSDQAKRKETQTRAGMIQQSLIRFQVDMGKLPTSAEGLDILVTNPGSNKWSGPYTDADQLKDGWGVPFNFELSPKGPKIISAGKDGQMGTGDDLPYINGSLQENEGGDGQAEAPKEGG
jgi:general secretion pathway protein G